MRATRGGRGPRLAARALLVVALALAPTRRAGAAEPEPRVPASPELPALLTWDGALQLLRERGLDLLIADAAALQAAGDLAAAGALRNPSVSLGAGPVFNYDASAAGCVGCQPYGLQWSVADGGLLFDVITARRALRLRAGREGLQAALLGRADAERVLTGLVKQAYVEVGLTLALLEFDRQVQEGLARTVELNRDRLERGAINRGDLARIRVQQLEAEQAVVRDRHALRLARVGLAFLLGARGPVPDFAVERERFTYRYPAALAGLSEADLIERALRNRPDLRAAGHLRRQAEAALALVRRRRFPDVTLGVAYSQYGSGAAAASPANAVVGAQLDLPVFHQLQGEVTRAQAQATTQALLEARAAAQVASDVGTALAALEGARRQTERLLAVELGRAQLAFDTVFAQFAAGKATLMDFLDAQRGLIATNVELNRDLDAFWSALFQLEQAVGEELR